MIQELVVTSVPRGLGGGSGFQPVRRTAGMDAAVEQRLKQCTGYSHPFRHGDDRNPVIYVHRVERVGGQPLHVLGRICDAGSEHTGRSNFLGHVVALGGEDARQRPAGPARLALVHPFQEARWPGGTEEPPPPAVVRPRDTPPGPLTPPDALRAAVIGELADAAMRGESVVLITPAGPEFDGEGMLRLFADALALVEPSRRWQVTFNTCEIEPFDAVWRAVRSDLPQAAAARSRGGRVIDMTAGVPASTNAYTTFARGETDFLPWQAKVAQASAGPAPNGHASRVPGQDDQLQQVDLRGEGTRAAGVLPPERVDVGAVRSPVPVVRRKLQLPQHADDGILDDMPTATGSFQLRSVVSGLAACLLVLIASVAGIAVMKPDWVDWVTRKLVPEPGVIAAVPDNPRKPGEPDPTPPLPRPDFKNEDWERQGRIEKQREKLKPLLIHFIEKAKELLAAIQSIPRQSSHEDLSVALRHDFLEMYANRDEMEQELQQILDAGKQIQVVVESKDTDKSYEEKLESSLGDAEGYGQQLNDLEPRLQQLTNKSDALLAQAKKEREQTEEKQAFAKLKLLKQAVVLSVPTRKTDLGDDSSTGNVVIDLGAIDLGPLKRLELSFDVAVPKEQFQDRTFELSISPESPDTRSSEPRWTVNYRSPSLDPDKGATLRSLAAIEVRNGSLYLLFEEPNGNPAMLSLFRRSVLLVKARDPDSTNTTADRAGVIHKIRLVEPAVMPSSSVNIFKTTTTRIPSPPGITLSTASYSVALEVGDQKFADTDGKKSGKGPGVSQHDLPAVRLHEGLDLHVNVQVTLRQAILKVTPELKGKDSRQFTPSKLEEIHVKSQEQLRRATDAWRTKVRAGPQAVPFEKWLEDLRFAVHPISLPNHATFSESMDHYLRDKYERTEENARPEVPPSCAEWIKDCQRVLGRMQSGGSRDRRDWDEKFTKPLEDWLKWYTELYIKEWNAMAEGIRQAVGHDSKIRLTIISLAYDKENNVYEVPLVIPGDGPPDNTDSVLNAGVSEPPRASDSGPPEL
jgi:hypothetical protein